MAVNPTADDLGLELERFARKVEAGARFAMTQVLFDLRPCWSVPGAAGRLAAPIPMLVGVWPYAATRSRFRLHNEVPGISVPPDGCSTGSIGPVPRPRARAWRSPVSCSPRLRDLAAGAYLVAPFGQPERVLDVLE